MKRPTKAQFERSRFDNDKGVREGSPADKKRDKAEMKQMARSQAKKAGPKKKK